MLAAVEQGGLVLESASDVRSKLTEKVVLAAVRHRWSCTGSCRGDALRALTERRYLLRFRKIGWTLHFASEALRADRDVALAAVAQDGSALEYASDALRDDKEIVLAAVRQNGWALRHASPDLQADREVVLAAVRQDGKCTQLCQRSAPSWTKKCCILRSRMGLH